ncbi:hypothetical protein ACO0SA_002461 [Hanseniaspora valbyensis]
MVAEKEFISKGSKNKNFIKLGSLAALGFLSFLYLSTSNSFDVGNFVMPCHSEMSMVDKVKDFTFKPDGKKCPVSEPLKPSFENYDIDNILFNETFKDLAASKLSGAIKIDTTVQDVNPSPQDDLDYWSNFFELHAYLEKEFPLVHEKLELEKINKIGLLYKWEGSDSSLKPMILMAHQDVVPVNPNTLDEWTYPAFDGVYDKETEIVWGRGAFDCKNLLIAELHTMEILLSQGFTPKRTLYVSLGFDEESSGIHGATYLANHLEEKLGPNSIYSIVDEGFGIARITDELFAATPILGEKGGINVKLSVEGFGGHSSSPPMSGHTNIGILSKLISLMEDTGFEPQFTPKNPIWEFLDCLAEWYTDIPEEFKDAIVKRDLSEYHMDKLLQMLVHQNTFKELVRTSQAVDIISGGVKSNALPEDVFTIVNHRIEVGSSVKEVFERDLAMARIIAKTYNYGLKSGDKILIPKTENGFIIAEIYGQPLEPAPVSPENEVWDLFKKTIYNTFVNGIDSKSEKKAQFVVSPSTATFNTDTKAYWNLTENIYRFMCVELPSDALKSFHSVDEHIAISGHLSTISFLYDYILNVNEYDS